MPQFKNGGGFEVGAFKQLLLQALDSGLASLGEEVRQVIYFHVEKTCGLKREQIPDNMDQFHNALVAILGEGSHVVERLIARHVGQSMGLPPDKCETMPLLDCVTQLKRKTQQ